GGLLVGQAYGGLNGKAEPQIVAVNRCVESKAFDSTGVSLRMEAAVWDLARPLLGPGAAIVGWYHSHPDLGAFFSDTDRTTQRSFFRQAFSVGIVIDPVRKQLKAYLGPDCVEIPGENVMVCRDEGGLRPDLGAFRESAAE
ncbi:MAG: Mov34/MPN/PAD-1 family protein, partial [Rhodospirillaceae bacterium]